MVLSVCPEAVVGLEQTLTRVSEGVGVVEVCAVVYNVRDCPIQLPFDVKLASRNGSAGKGRVITDYYNHRSADVSLCNCSIYHGLL